MDEYIQFVPDVHFEKIPIKNLVSNQDYQRNLSRSHIEKAADNFDIYQINPVKVSRREGINYVFNGQHTIEIVARVSGSRETPVWCMIYDDLDYEEEADIFANQQKYVKQLVPYEVFVANIEAGNHDEIMIKELVESFGLHIGKTRSHDSICAVSTLENIYKKYGYHILRRVLTLIIAAWEGEENSFSSNMMNAVAKLCYVYQENLNDEVFKDKLGAISVKKIARMAKERRPGALGYAETLVIEYNGKKKNRTFMLSMNKLHAKEDDIFDLDNEDEDEDYINERLEEV